MPQYARMSVIAASKGASSVESGVLRNLPRVAQMLQRLAPELDAMAA